MSTRSPARFLAPLALAVAVVAVLVVLSSSDADSGSASSVSPGPLPARTATTTAHRSSATYTVRPGDTLTAIAGRTGVSLARLQTLNAQVDANSLHAGQKLKLRPES